MLRIWEEERKKETSPGNDVTAKRNTHILLAILCTYLVTIVTARMKAAVPNSPNQRDDGDKNDDYNDDRDNPNPNFLACNDKNGKHFT